MFAFEDEATVNLIAQYHDVSVTNRSGDLLDVDLSKHAPGRVLRGIHNDQLGPIADHPGELIHVEPEIHLLAQPDRHRFSADVIDHRFVNWEPGIRVNDLIVLFAQRKDREEDDRFAARHHHDLVG